MVLKIHTSLQSTLGTGCGCDLVGSGFSMRLHRRGVRSTNSLQGVHSYTVPVHASEGQCCRRIQGHSFEFEVLWRQCDVPVIFGFFSARSIQLKSTYVYQLPHFAQHEKDLSLSASKLVKSRVNLHEMVTPLLVLPSTLCPSLSLGHINCLPCVSALASLLPPLLLLSDFHIWSPV